MNSNLLSFARSLVLLLPLIGLLFGFNSSILYPIWIAAIALIVALTLIVWYKQGRSFKPFVPLSLAIIGALLITGIWMYITR